MNTKLLLSISLLLGLCGCVQFPLGAEELMRPPALTQEQLEISSALEQAVGGKDITYKYPEQGENRSSFLFRDLDGDGEEEALVFYQAGPKGSGSWVSVLDHQGDSWVSLCDLSAPNGETEVDFVDFQPLLRRQDCIVIGWADDNLNDKSAVVYTFDGSSLLSQYEVDYDQVCFGDLNRDGRLDLVAVSCDPFYEECSVSLASQVDNITGKAAFSRLSRLDLPIGSVHLLNAQIGLAAPGKPALFLDCRVNISRNETRLVSHVLGVEGSQLVNLLETEELSLSEDSLRPTQTLCQDSDSNGILEVPCVTALPGYEGQDDVLYETSFNELGPDHSWKTVRRCVINPELRYQFTLPERWLDTVTVLNQPSGNEWSFVQYGGSLEDSSLLLLRIKVYSAKDYHDKFDSDSFTLVGQQGLFEYYVHIPQNLEEQPLAISLEEFQRCFAFLSPSGTISSPEAVH